MRHEKIPQASGETGKRARGVTRLLLFLLPVLLCLLLPFIVSAEDPKDEKPNPDPTICEHQFDNFFIEDGRGHYGICTKCGAIGCFNHNIVEVTSHDYYNHTGICTVCHEEVRISHTWAVDEEAEDPTAEGHNAYCTLCGEKAYQIHENNYDYTFIDLDKDRDPASDAPMNGHLRACTICGYEYGDDPAPHEYLWAGVSGEYVCLSGGYASEYAYHYKVCKMCGHIDWNSSAPHEFDEVGTYTKHIIRCHVCGIEYIVDHTFDGTYTDNGDGTHGLLCTVCQIKTNEDHQWVFDSESSDPLTSEGHNVYCKVCGAKDFLPHDHIIDLDAYDPQSGSPEHGHQFTRCYTCGFSTDAEPHEYELVEIPGDSENHYKVCRICGHVDNTSATPHRYEYEPAYGYYTYDRYTEDYTGNHRMTCRDCGKEILQPHRYEKDAYTDKGDGTCSNFCLDCQATFTSKHIWICRFDDDSFIEPTAEGHYCICYSCGKPSFQPHEEKDLDFYNADNLKDPTPPGKPEVGHGKSCMVCMYFFGFEPHDYVWKTDGETSNHYKVCTKCERGTDDLFGYGLKGVHEFEITVVYDDDGHSHHVKTCIECGYAFPEEHDYQWEQLPDDSDNHYKVCTKCGHVDGTGASHTSDGAWQSDEVDHWKICSECGAEMNRAEHDSLTYTANDDGETHKVTCGTCGKEITAAEAHFWKWEALPDEAKEKAVCVKCGAEGETRNTHEHKPVKHGAKDPTCTEDGNPEYWTCTADDGICDGKYYKDDTCTTEYTAEEIILEATGHSLTETAAKDATCTAEGNTKYYTCENCGKYFSDSEGKDEITKDSWIVKKAEHTYKDGVCTVCGTADPDYVEPDKYEDKTSGAVAEYTDPDVEYNEEIVLTVEPVTEEKQEAKDALAAVEKASKETFKDTAVYNITLKNTTSGAEIQPDGKIKITLKVPEGWEVVVYRVEEDGSVTDMKATMSEDGKTVSFVTEHLSTYVLANTKASAPQTSDFILFPVALLLIGTVSGVEILRLRKKSAR